MKTCLSDVESVSGIRDEVILLLPRTPLNISLRAFLRFPGFHQRERSRLNTDNLHDHGKRYCFRNLYAERKNTNTCLCCSASRHGFIFGIHKSLMLAPFFFVFFHVLIDYYLFKRPHIINMCLTWYLLDLLHDEKAESRNHLCTNILTGVGTFNPGSKNN